MNVMQHLMPGPDGWSSGWLALGTPVPTRLRHQLGGGGVVFWTAIVGDKIVGPFRVPKGFKKV